MKITDDILYAGVNDREIDLFEGQYDVPNGMAYNSYVILDEKIAVTDTVDRRFGKEWLENLARALGGKTPDYLIVHHVEPDHSAGIALFLNTYPKAKIVGNAQTFRMLANFYGEADLEARKVVVADGQTLSLGRHELTFVTAPMVHWPEVMMTYDAADRALFSADAFGKFGAQDADEEWDCEARRYYFGIVGKYGAQVQAVLKKLAGFEIKAICPLHGPVLTDGAEHALSLYQTWSAYGVESEGVVIAYTSVYGNTKQAAEILAEALRKAGCPKVSLHDLARDDVAEAVEDAFRYGKLVLAATTYNAGVFPPMRTFIEHLVERNYQKRTVALVENGSWAPMAAKAMRTMLEGCKEVTVLDPVVTLKSAVTAESVTQLEALAAALCPAG